MQKSRIALLIYFFSGSLLAKVVQFDEPGQDVNVPTAIWSQFGQVSGKNTIVFGDVQVRLVEKNPKVLNDSEIIFKFPRGGGEVDLSQFIRSENPGTFFVYFEFDEIPADEKGKAFFISRARKRKIEDLVWGAGCNKFMDIKKYIFGKGQKKGIEVNTSRNRHLSILGGTFFFANGNRIAQVTFKDSTQPDLFCDNEIASEGRK